MWHLRLVRRSGRAPGEPGDAPVDTRRLRRSYGPSALQVGPTIRQGSPKSNLASRWSQVAKPVSFSVNSKRADVRTKREGQAMIYRDIRKLRLGQRPSNCAFTGEHR